MTDVVIALVGFIVALGNIGVVSALGGIRTELTRLANAAEREAGR